jgi:hypothetical protein
MSTEVTEAPVSTETAKTDVPTGKAAFTAARASIAAQSTDQGPAESGSPKPDDTPATKTPAEDPAKVTDQPPEVTDDPDALLTPDEVAKLSAKERGLYEKAQKNYTLKTQKLAEQRKEFDEWKPLIEALKTNPDAAIEQIAQQRGLKVSKAVQDTTVETKAAETLAQLPDELQFLKPVFEQFGKQIMATVEGKLKPIEQAHTAMVTEAAAAETEGTIKAFDAKYPGWKKHEAQMMELGKKFIPVAGTSTDFEYMENLYKLVTADMKKVEQVKETIKQINKSAESVEPNQPGVSDSRVEHALPPPDKRSMRDAFKAASQGIRWTK